MSGGKWNSVRCWFICFDCFVCSFVCSACSACLLCLPLYVFVRQYVCLLVLSVFLFVCLLLIVCLCIHWFACLFVCLLVWLFDCLFVCSHVFFSLIFPPGARQAKPASQLREAPDAVRPVHRETFRGVCHLQRFRLPKQKQRLFAGDFTCIHMNKKQQTSAARCKEIRRTSCSRAVCGTRDAAVHIWGVYAFSVLVVVIFRGVLL